LIKPDKEDLSMKTLRIAQAALALILVVGISSNSFAFMVVAAADQSTAKSTDLSQMVDSLRAEIDAGETKCEDILAKLNAALDNIDARLDIGVPNEEEYLAARQTIAEMRYDLECVAHKLTAQIVTGGAAAAGAAAGAAPAVTGFGAVGAAGAAGAGAGAAGGGSLSSLAGLGIIGGGVAAVSSNSSSPGFVASQSVSN
jgi:hypothetical protein